MLSTESSRRIWLTTLLYILKIFSLQMSRFISIQQGVFKHHLFFCIYTASEWLWAFLNSGFYLMLPGWNVQPCDLPLVCQQPAQQLEPVWNSPAAGGWWRTHTRIKQRKTSAQQLFTALHKPVEDGGKPREKRNNKDESVLSVLLLLLLSSLFWSYMILSLLFSETFKLMMFISLH